MPQLDLSQIRVLPQTGSPVMPFIRGAGQGLTMGLSEPIGASLASLAAAGFNPMEAYRIYPEMRGIAEQQRAQLEQQNPQAYRLGEIGVPAAAVGLGTLSMAGRAAGPSLLEMLGHASPRMGSRAEKLLDARRAGQTAAQVERETAMNQAITNPQSLKQSLTDTEIIGQEIANRMRHIRANNLLEEARMGGKSLSFDDAYKLVDQEIAQGMGAPKMTPQQIQEVGDLSRLYKITQENK